jgi:hypothetical protein
MADGDPLKQINEQLSGIRFFNGTPLIGISCALTIEVTGTFQGGRILTSVYDAQSGSADTTVVARKIISGSATLDATAVTISASTKGFSSLAYLVGSADVESGSLKVARAAASPSGSADTLTTARRIRHTSSTQSGDSSVSVSGKNIRISQSSLTQLLTVTMSDVGTIRVLDTEPLSSSVTLLIADLLRFTPNSRTPGSIVSLLLLDGQPLTAQNRKYTNSNKPIYVEKKNWNAAKSRYYKNKDKSGRMSFKLSWDWLPSEREDTIDKRFARNFIKDKSIDPDVHTLTILSYGINPEDILQETEYNVFITGYDESLIRRDLQSNIYFWNCSLDLEEV